ncbi:hypothetical protein MNBD_UNCLBAC01-588 [hydrothermal vent metagenome]|uniref:Lysophospholipid acyltransferase n=1 Tax=hydrothermal vent metagenome TaxID=652676 RepID=A0A3B1DMV9_9ZZZZ
MNQKIKVKKRGNAFGFWFFKSAIQLFGLRGAYGLLYIVCFYYVIFDNLAVKNALAYIKRRFKGCHTFKLYWHVYLLFVNQGKALIDRYVVTAGVHTFDTTLQGYEDVKKVVEKNNTGAILLTSHVGNWQVALHSLKKLNKNIYLVMREEDNRSVQKNLKVDEEADAIKIISPEQAFGGAIEITNRLNKGDMVSMMGDRKYGFQSLDVHYMGDKAEFPYGAFSIAAAVQCPVIVLLTAKISSGEYVVDFRHVFYPVYEKGISKKEQLKKWVQEYVMILEDYVESYPYQCFLFADIWDYKENI